MSIVFTQGGDVQLLDLATAGGLLDRINLYQNDRVPLPFDTISDYTIADFSGYVPDTAIAWLAAFVNDFGKGQITGATVTWTRAAGAVSNTCFGIYVINTAGDLIYAERFPSPAPFIIVGDAFAYTPVVTSVSE